MKSNQPLNQNQEQLPNYLNNLISKYPGNRDRSVLTRSHKGATYLMLNTVDPDLKEYAANASTMGIIINIFLDDFADKYSRRDLIELAENYMMNNTDFKNEELDYLKTIWSTYLSLLSEYAPSYDKIKDILLIEWQKLLHALEFSIKINLYEVNPTFEESLEMLSSNMHHVIKHLIDVCFSSNWKTEDTALLLEFAYSAQRITRLGNWLKSWELEIKNEGRKDITSGVFPLGLKYRLFTLEELQKSEPEEIINIINNTKVAELSNLTIPDYMYLDIQNRIKQLGEYKEKINFINIEEYMERLWLVVQEQLKSKNERR